MNRPVDNPKPFIFRLRISRRGNSVVDVFASTFYTPGVRCTGGRSLGDALRLERLIACPKGDEGVGAKLDIVHLAALRSRAVP